MGANRKRIGILMGGMSVEHDVSVMSGSLVSKKLDRKKYEAIPITITREGDWVFPKDGVLGITEALVRLAQLELDCIFLALHGPFGEDGRIQGLLDLLGIPYTGSGCRASAIAIDKVRCKALVRELGVRVPKHIAVDRSMWEKEPELVTGQVKKELGFSCVVKSPCQGSSFGMSIPATAVEFREAVEMVLEYGDEFMVEEYILGAEVTCGVLDVEPGALPTPLPVTEICPISSSYFDYEAKYTPGACEDITPADLPDELTRKVQEVAVRVHRAVGCELWSRSDLIIKGVEPVWFEVNTIPGMTPTSLYPQGAEAAGISFPKLLETFIEATIAQKA